MTSPRNLTGGEVSDLIARGATITELTCVAPSGGRPRPCGAGLGEALVPVQIVGVFKRWDDRRNVSVPRDVRRCRKCGWYSAYHPCLDTGGAGS